MHFIQSIILDPVPKSNRFTILQHNTEIWKMIANKSDMVQSTSFWSIEMFWN